MYKRGALQNYCHCGSQTINLCMYQQNNLSIFRQPGCDAGVLQAQSSTGLLSQTVTKLQSHKTLYTTVLTD